MIWDFRGPHALKVAEHHERHLKDYIEMEALNTNFTGVETLSDVHALAFMVVDEAQVMKLRSLLKPHRGVIYKP